ncbi:ganglioside GM2 activator-like [Liolophura sinensis]|uniref:ganglioside GM2 activator-like n=1 Tax=Liolophura sinensis TaxID=3198878 RepID=UPI0031595E2D
MVPTIFLVVSALCFQQAFSASYFKFVDCGTDPNRPIIFKEGDVTPHPLQLPGTIGAHFTAQVKKDVGNNPIIMDVSINKTVLGQPQKIPCVSQVGTCHYPDVCAMISKYKTSGCPKEIDGTNLPCFCPFKAGTVTLAPTNFVVEKVNALYTWLASGEFQARLQLHDSVTKNEVGCLYAQIQVGKQGFLFG